MIVFRSIFDLFLIQKSNTLENQVYLFYYNYEETSMINNNNNTNVSKNQKRSSSESIQGFDDFKFLESVSESIAGNIIKPEDIFIIGSPTIVNGTLGSEILTQPIDYDIDTLSSFKDNSLNLRRLLLENIEDTFKDDSLNIRHLLTTEDSKKSLILPVDLNGNEDRMTRIDCYLWIPYNYTGVDPLRLLADEIFSGRFGTRLERNNFATNNRNSSLNLLGLAFVSFPDDLGYFNKEEMIEIIYKDNSSSNYQNESNIIEEEECYKYKTNTLPMIISFVIESFCIFIILLSIVSRFYT